MTDELDLAAEREQLARDVALQAHQNRPARPIPLCEECDEKRCHVTSLDVVWRFCADCAESRLRSQ